MTTQHTATPLILDTFTNPDSFAKSVRVAVGPIWATVRMADGAIFASSEWMGYGGNHAAVDALGTWKAAGPGTFGHCDLYASAELLDAVRTAVKGYTDGYNGRRDVLDDECGWFDMAYAGVDAYTENYNRGWDAMTRDLSTRSTTNA